MVGKGVTVRNPAQPQVVLRDGSDASGMATMIADLLRDNLRDFPGRARVAARARGALVLTAADRGLSITIRFDHGEIEVVDGAEPAAPSMAGPWLAMSRVCSGRISPLRALVERELTLRPGRHIGVIAAGGYVLSVPASFYGDAAAIRKRRLIALVSVSVAVSLATTMVVRSRRHGGDGP